MTYRSWILLAVALLLGACPEEEEKNYPVLSGTGAGSLPGNVPAPQDDGTPEGTATETDTGTGSGTGSTDGTATEGSGTHDGGGTVGATDSIGEPPTPTTGPLTTG